MRSEKTCERKRAMELGLSMSWTKRVLVRVCRERDLKMLDERSTLLRVHHAGQLHQRSSNWERPSTRLYRSADIGAWIHGIRRRGLGIVLSHTLQPIDFRSLLFEFLTQFNVFLVIARTDFCELLAPLLSFGLLLHKQARLAQKSIDLLLDQGAPFVPSRQARVVLADVCYLCGQLLNLKLWWCGAWYLCEN